MLQTGLQQKQLHVQKADVRNEIKEFKDKYKVLEDYWVDLSIKNSYFDNF